MEPFHPQANRHRLPQSVLLPRLAIPRSSSGSLSDAPALRPAQQTWLDEGRLWETMFWQYGLQSAEETGEDLLDLDRPTDEVRIVPVPDTGVFSGLAHATTDAERRDSELYRNEQLRDRQARSLLPPCTAHDREDELSTLYHWEDLKGKEAMLSAVRVFNNFALFIPHHKITKELDELASNAEVSMSDLRKLFITLMQELDRVHRLNVAQFLWQDEPRSPGKRQTERYVLQYCGAPWALFFHTVSAYLAREQDLKARRLREGDSRTMMDYLKVLGLSEVAKEREAMREAVNDDRARCGQQAIEWRISQADCTWADYLEADTNEQWFRRSVFSARSRKSSKAGSSHNGDAPSPRRTQLSDVLKRLGSVRSGTSRHGQE
ncbi:hypothetical protein JCM10213_000241 [Rhodosporidiobolus nylandii]